MVPICLCFLFSSVAKENSTAIINPGPNPQEVQRSTAPLLALSLPQHFPGQHSGHGIGGSSHTTALGSSPLVSPLTAAPRAQQGIPWGQGPQGGKGNNSNSPCRVDKVGHFEMLPLTPLPPIPQAMFRNGPCVRLITNTVSSAAPCLGG